MDAMTSPSAPGETRSIAVPGSIANAVLRRDDQVGCVLFGPIDAAEGATPVCRDQAADVATCGSQSGSEARHVDPAGNVLRFGSPQPPLIIPPGRRNRL